MILVMMRMRTMMKVTEALKRLCIKCNVPDKAPHKTKIAEAATVTRTTQTI